MTRKTKIKVAYRRKREGRTDYKKRLNLLLADRPRLVVRKSSKSMLIQLIAYETNGDKTVAIAHTNDLQKLGWKHGGSNIPSAYLAGYLAGKKGIAAGCKKAILDIGLQAKGERIFAALKGAVDAGLSVPYDEKVLPDELRIKGEHIALYKKVADIIKDFEKVKEKIK